MHLLRNRKSPETTLLAFLFLVYSAAAMDQDPASHPPPSAPPDRSPPARLHAAAEPPVTEVDVLVVYTTAARDAAGGVGPLTSAILDGFAEANQIYSNSLTQVRLNPVALVPWSSPETGSIMTDLPSFASEQGASLRNEYRADLVMMVYETDKSEISGAAGPGKPGPTGNSSAAFFAFQRSRPSGMGEGIANRSGILLGADGSHPSNGAFSFATRHSFVVDGVEVGTIMGSGGMTIPHFSNPDVLYRGERTGIPGVADNAAAIREIGPMVAAYQRCTNRVRFELTATTVHEKDGSVRLRLLRTGPPETAAQLMALAVNGTAKSGTDFEFSSQLVAFAPGEMVQTLEVPLIQDDLPQGPRTFQLRLASPGPGTGVGSVGVIDITLEDDDLPFRFMAGEGFITEGGPTTAVSVLRTQGIDAEASVSLGAIPPESNGSILASPGQGTPPAVLPLVVRFAPGQSEATVQLSVPDDSDPRPDAAIRLGLQGSWPEGTPSTSLTLWVRDNDLASGALRSIAALGTAGTIEGPVLPLPDGSFLAGRRTRRGGAIQLERIQPDGTSDPQWPALRFKEHPAPDAGLQFGRLNQIVRQPDGKILVAGFFAAVNDTLGSGLVRLLPQGTVDPQFQIGEGFDGPVRSVCVQPDGAVVAVGAFARVDGVTRNAAARLLPNGSLDDAFRPTFSGLFQGYELTAVAMQSDKILVSGQFTHVGGHAAAGIARLHPNGTADTSFRSTFDGVATGFRVLPGGAFYAFGPFVAPTRWAGRFRANGVLESLSRFRGLDGPVHDLLPLAGGEAYVCGQFAGKTASQPLFIRFSTDGIAQAGFGPRFDPAGSVTAMLAGPAGGLTLIGSMIPAGGTEAASMVHLAPGSWSTELKTPQAIAGGMVVEAQTLPGLTHRLERSQDMVRWEVIDSQDATSTATRFHDPSPTTAAVYRLSVGNAQPTAP